MQLNLRKGGFDLPLLLAVLLMAAMSIALIYSAKHNSLSEVERALFFKQAIWMGLGLLAMWIAFAVPMRTHEVLAYMYYAGGLVLLAALFVAGSTKYGATRWFNLGPLNIQPSELMKVAAILALARYLAYPKRSTGNFIWVIVAVLLALVPMVLVLRQPDLGTSTMFLVLLLSTLFWSGLPFSFILLLITPFLSLALAFHWIPWGVFFFALLVALLYLRPGRCLGAFVVGLNLLAGIVTPLLWSKLHDYQKARILSFLDPANEPLGAGYQLIQSKVALGSGGLLGKGYLNSSQARLEFLPMQHTDFIFSVLGEEFGLLGCLVILIILGYVVYRGILIARKARNNFASLIAWGIISIFSFQFLVNIGMTVGLLPVTGIPLPFLSYGGSAMLVNWFMIGLLQNINAHWQEY